MSNVKSNEYYSNNNYKSTNNTNSESSLNNKNTDIDLNPCEININIQTSENTHEQLTLTTNDNIDEKVDAFCKAHNFPQSVRLMLIQQVEEQIDQKISQMEGYSEDNDDSNEMNRITPTKSLIMSKSCDNIIAPKPVKKKKRRHSKSPSGYGQEMYEREMHRRQRRLNHYQKLKEENEQRDMEESTFTPKLNERSRQILNRSKSQLKLLSTEDRLILMGKESERKRLQKMVEKSFNDDIIGNIQNETFTPKINKGYKTPKLRNNKSQSVYSNLYQDAKILAEKRNQKFIEIQARECTFHPKISQRSQKLNKKESASAMINRLAKKKEDNKEIVIKKIFTYQPVITRGPKNPNQRNVTVNLDSNYDKKLFEEKMHIHNNEMCNALEKKQQWLSRSMNIVMKMKILKYKEIFDLLDGDRDGFVSYDKIKLSDVDNNILIAITPLLEEITKNKEEMMTFKEFVVVADKYIANQIFQK